MAFFGLTALGPQNAFQSASKSFRNLQIFEEADFAAAWHRVNGPDAKFCQASRLGDVMRALYRGPVPPNDNEYIVRAFQQAEPFFETPGVLSLQVTLTLTLTLDSRRGCCGSRQPAPHP